MIAVRLGGEHERSGAKNRLRKKHASTRQLSRIKLPNVRISITRSDEPARENAPMECIMNTIKGQHEGPSIETILLSEPCYHNFLLGDPNLHTRMSADGLKRFMRLTKQLSHLRLMILCQSCAKQVATGMTVGYVDKPHMKRGSRGTIKNAKSVKFICVKCAESAGVKPLPTSTVAWPQVSPDDQYGAQMVRSALLLACGYPQIHHADQDELEAFFAEPSNFNLPQANLRAAA